MKQSPATPDPFDAFRKIVLASPPLLKQLRAAPDITAFVSRVVEMAGQQGFQFTAEEVHAALRASPRAWIERWI
jgi:hypothetical protein